MVVMYTNGVTRDVRTRGDMKDIYMHTIVS